MRSFSYTATGFLLVFVALAEISCHKPEGDFTSDFTALVASASTNKQPVVEIGNVTKFSWDKVIIFGPYTPLSAIDRQLGYAWSPKDRVDYDVPVGLQALVFMKTGKVVCFVEFPRHSGDFVGLTNGNIILPGADSFKVELRNDTPSWFDLVSIGKRGNQPKVDVH